MKMMNEQLKEEKKEKILLFMKEDAYRPLLFDELVQILVVPESDIKAFRDILKELEQEGKIFKTNKKRYGIPEKMNLVTGRLQGNEKGYGFVIPDNEKTNDVFISFKDLNGAMHNDRVIVRINTKAYGARNSEGEVVKILKRANRTVVGTFEKSRYFGFVVPDNRKITTDVFIARDEFNGAKAGQKVVAEIVKWPERRRNPEGKVVEIIGDQNEPGTDILSVMYSYGLSKDFPEDVIKQANNIQENITEDMFKGRTDLRDLRMVTIDGEDAKDLDDAVSIEKLDNGNYKLGVHIADVSFYVTEDSPLDREALERGTSVYLVDRVVPMLPEKLSNGICSLNAGADRLAFSVMMEINSKGQVVNYDIFESVINVNERMTYKKVYGILEQDDRDAKKQYRYLTDDFKIMKQLAKILKRKRMARGAIDFDFEESKIILDDNGKPVEIKKYETTIANRIIEEFMLVCNETVAEHFYWVNIPFVYRIHEDPEKEKIEAFSEMTHNLGYTLKGINQIHPGALQRLLYSVKGKKEERIISTAMLRSLQKARYSQIHENHFGLAAEYYSHFTSPIRRYPDLLIHRIMKEYIKGQLDEVKQESLNERLKEIALKCSESEREAEEAERETEDLKKVEYMKELEGETFKGVISNITSFGMFIELANTIEGLVKLSNLEDDYYQFVENQYCLFGERTGKVYRIGDEITVIVARADILSRQIDFIPTDIVDEMQENGNNNQSDTATRINKKGKRYNKRKNRKLSYKRNKV